MDVHKLWEYREYANVNGVMLSGELITRLQSTLTALQSENHFRHMLYWGQLLGADADYHVAAGLGDDALRDRKYYYSTDLKVWSMLPKPKKKYKYLSLLAYYPFRGDPTVKLKVADESLDAADAERCLEMREEKRLAATVSTISEEAAAAARGQLLQYPDGRVALNPQFYGLSAAEARQLQSYVHVRAPQQRWSTNLLTRQDYNYSFDFLDSVDQDIPAGCWSLAVERCGAVAYLRSLYWPGMVYFHKINTPDAGFLYIGNGRKNLDVPFLL